MTYKRILKPLKLPKYEETKFNKKISKSLKYGNPPLDYYNVMKMKDPILNWRKYLKIIPKPQDHRSDAVKKELLYLKKLNESLTKKQKKRINLHDVPTYDFIDFLKENGYDVNFKLFKAINDELGNMILNIKNHINRPRPFQMALYHKIDLYPLRSQTAWSGSYPSGHGFQSAFWYKYYSYKFPKIKSKLKKFCKEYADSRIYAGYHYPSDNLVSIKLANHFFKKNRFLTLEKKVKEKYNL